jgi:hypothetical protein
MIAGVRYGHTAFAVASASGRCVTWCVTDPEGDIVELQSWS